MKQTSDRRPSNDTNTDLPSSHSLFRSSLLCGGALGGVECVRVLRGTDFQTALLAGSPVARIAAWGPIYILSAAAVVFFLGGLLWFHFGDGSKAASAAALALGIFVWIAEGRAGLSPGGEPESWLRRIIPISIALLISFASAFLLAGGASAILKLIGVGALEAWICAVPVLLVAVRCPGLSYLLRAVLVVSALLAGEVLRRRMKGLPASPLIVVVILAATILGASVFAGRADSRSASSSPAGSGPNVLLVSVDTLRYDESISPAGAPPKMLAVDRLAREGTIFDLAESAAPNTIPAMAAMMTGRYPSSLGMSDPFDLNLPLGETLATRLSRAGYRTGAVTANDFSIPTSSFRAGFDRLIPPWVRGPLLEPVLESRSLQSVFLFSLRRPLRHPHFREGAPPVADRALEWLGANRTAPWFLWLHFNDPHAPYYDSDEKLAGARFPGAEGALVPERLGAPKIWQGGRAKLLPAYRDEISRVDRALSGILDALEKRGDWSHTLVVLMADHGEEFLDHGSYFHGHAFYEELIHVPLVIRWPAGAASVWRGTRVVSRVRTADVSPTIEEIASLRPIRSDGESLIPLVDGKEPPIDRDAVSEGNCFFEPRVAFYRGSAKLVLGRDGRFLSYLDLKNDPLETGKCSEAPQLFLDSARAWLAPRANLLLGAPSPAQLSPQLRSLGYLR